MDAIENSHERAHLFDDDIRELLLLRNEGERERERADAGFGQWIREMRIMNKASHTKKPNNKRSLEEN